MKLVKGIRYGLKPIKRIYLGHDIVYDTRTFVLQHGYGDLESDVIASLKKEPITNANMIYTVDMYAIADPEIYDGDGVGVNDNDGIISACAVGTFDDIAFAATHGDLTDILKAMVAGVVVQPSNALAFGDDGVLSIGDIDNAQGPMVFGNSIGIGSIIGNGNSATAKAAYGNIDGNPLVIGGGHSADTVKVYSVDNNICFTVATPDATRFIEIEGFCQRLLACIGSGNRSTAKETSSIDNNILTVIGAGKNSYSKKAYSVDNKPFTTISDGENHSGANAEANSALNIIANSYLGTDSQIFVDANSNLIINVSATGDSVIPRAELSHSSLHIASTLNVEDVSQRNADAHGRLHIETTFDGATNDHIDLGAISNVKTSTKSAPDITQPYKVNLSGTANPHTIATSMTWHYPEQDGDVLFIIQAYEAVYNEETKTLEIK